MEKRLEDADGKETIRNKICREKLKIIGSYLGQIYEQINYKWIGKILDLFAVNKRIGQIINWAVHSTSKLDRGGFGCLFY